MKTPRTFDWHPLEDLAHMCLEVSEQKKKEILQALDTDWRTTVIDIMTQIKVKKDNRT